MEYERLIYDLCQIDFPVQLLMVITCEYWFD